jgi:hypothetical protein
MKTDPRALQACMGQLEQASRFFKKSASAVRRKREIGHGE